MENNFYYSPEELMPIVAKLAERSTDYQSTSITYEKAEQLIEAINYCINEFYMTEGIIPMSPDSAHLSAEMAYAKGVTAVNNKVQRCMLLYNKMLRTFNDYNVISLNDTFIKAIPEFFKWYDIDFAPQANIITYDYPVQKDLSEYCGVDKLFEYLMALQEEQEYLATFEDGYVEDSLLQYHSHYEDLFDNILSILAFIK